MKKNIKLGSILLLFASIVFVSCDKWIDTEINENPNSPLDVPMELLVPSIQTSMAYDLGGNDAVRTLGIWMQYFNGVDRQSEAEGHYIYTPANCNNLWNSLYSSSGEDLSILIQKASELTTDGEPKSVYTRGMAKVMMADLLGFTTNLWNDIPYTEAFLGDVQGIMNPKLDTQEQIYATIDQLLADAISDLSSPSSVVPIEGDMVFGGDETQWLATAYALRARYTLLIQKRIGNSAYTDALSYAQSALDNGFEGYIFDNFGTAANAKNPLAQFMNERSGDLVMATTFIDMLLNNSDPRYDEYSDGSQGFGSTPGTSDPGDLPGPYAADATAPVRHMNLSEVYFIISESYFQTANTDDAFTAFMDGINSSLDDAVGDHSVLPDNLPASGASLTFEDIMVQKYIANFGNVQGYNDWRRTGYPVLAIAVDATMLEIPRRYPYPQEEETYNSNVSNVGLSITDRVWWDVE